MQATALIAVFFATVMAASGATVIGVNFARHPSGVPDGAGTQASGNSFGATWTDIITDNVTGQALNGTSFTMNLAANGWWNGGSWTGTDGPNSEISVFRNYLNDNGITINLNGLSAWLGSEGMTGYTITLYASSDNGTSFRDATVGAAAVPITVFGNGTWDGTTNDPLGNDAGGIRGMGITGVLTDDAITISLPSHAFPARASLAAFVVTAVPEPGSAMLAGLGLAACFRRRRRG
jgi:hypothetical protein